MNYSSIQLENIQRNYIMFKNVILNMIEENKKTINKIQNIDRCIEEYYSVDENPVDKGYTKRASKEIDVCLMNLKNILGTVENKIYSLSRQIESARDRELAESLAKAGL